MKGLITDRTIVNVNRCSQLSAIGWPYMSEGERAEWSGNPFTAQVGGYNSPVNLIPPHGDGVTFRDGSIICDGSGVIELGAMTDWVGQQFTLSCPHMTGSGMSLGVQNGSYTEVVALNSAGSVSGTIPNTLTSGNLQLRLTEGYYSKVMLELSPVMHEYVPYYEILPTNTTKGAYNYSDMNRVERVVGELAELLELNLQTKTDWSVWDIPTRNEINRYLGNLRAIRERLTRTDMLPDNLDKLTHTIANDIESFLEMAYRCADAAYRVGDLFSGEA